MTPLVRVTPGSACLNTPEAKRRELAALVEQLVLEDAAGVPTYYVLGGDAAPSSGLDCSGLVVWAARQLGLDLKRLGIRVTDDMWRRFARVETPEPGDVALYGSGREPDPAVHVVVVLGEGPDAGGYRVASMSGGGRWCTSLQLARERTPPARLREFKSQHYGRGDFIGFYRLPFADGNATATAATDARPVLPAGEISDPEAYAAALAAGRIEELPPGGAS